MIMIMILVEVLMLELISIEMLLYANERWRNCAILGSDEISCDRLVEWEIWLW